MDESPQYNIMIPPTPKPVPKQMDRFIFLLVWGSIFILIVMLICIMQSNDPGFNLMLELTKAFVMTVLGYGLSLVKKS